uniref:ELYS-like domain-containing protein n=1 Tax=Anopheles dirus TaxID=7168 RepID=A0A182NR72_9DIPT
MSTDISVEKVDVLRYSREQCTPAEGADAEEKSGILERNGLAWYARESVLEVFNINSSFKVISQNFQTCVSKTKLCTVECVEEVEAPDCTLLAVGLRLGTEQSQIVFLSLRGSREVGRIDVQEDVKLLRYVDPNSCSIGLLSKYQGCIAAGTEDGKIILVDLCFKQQQNGYGLDVAMNTPDKRQCHIEFSRGDMKQLMQNHEKVQERGLYFGLQLSHGEEASVECMLDIVPLKVICIGFADGTVLLWDLVDHTIMHRINPPTDDCGVVTLNYVEPSDDPKACLYLWICYSHAEGAFAFMHMIMCEEKYIQQGTFVYDQFVSCSSRLTLTSYDPGSVPLNVQTVTKKVSQEDEPITLCVLSWLGSNRTTTVMVFDLNQWYKAEMPYDCDWQQELTHTVVFQLPEESFHARLSEKSLVLFRSLQRPEEHFYPSSLAFDIMNFSGFNRTIYRWIGLQNKLLQYLELDGANGVIQPAALYGMLCRAALLPQFYEPVSPADGVVKEQREFILSLALEYNCHGFLQSCIDLWADGSQLGADPQQGVSLSTVTDWIWNRSKALKTVCNRMLAALMTDEAGRRVDARTQDALSHCTRQMQQLAELYRSIIRDYLEFIPEAVRERLSKESDSISAAAEYQDILQWLLHIGVLPEANDSDEEGENDPLQLVPYPYSRLAEFYRKRRRMLEDGDRSNDMPDLPAIRRLLFIDNLLEREFDRETVWKAWHEGSNADRQPLYPPRSLQKALRVLLIPDARWERKLVLLLYLFMDVVAAVEDERHFNVVRQLEKFPRIFKLNIGMMRRVQAFWHLDHGNVSETVEEFLSPLSGSIDFPQWHRELAVSVLLQLDAPNLALKVLRAPGSPVSPQLELTTLVQNNLVPEAFSLQRRSPQPDGRQLVWFIEAILRAGKPDTLLEFALNDDEKQVLRYYLRDSHLEVSDNLMLGHLLQNFEFVDAVQLVDRLGRKRDVEVQKKILGLYHKALDPTSQQLAYLSYQHAHELEPKLGGDGSGDGGSPTSPTVKSESLSSCLIRNRADFRVRVMHRSITAIKEAAMVVGLQHDRPFLEKPSLGNFRGRPTVRSLNVCYPVRLDPTMNKRRQRECDMSFEELARGQKPASPLLNEEDGFGNPRKKRFLGPDHTNPSTATATFGRKLNNFDVPVPVIPEFRPMKPKFNFTAPSFNTAVGSNGVDRAARSTKSTSHSPSIFLTTPPLAKTQQHLLGGQDHSNSLTSDAHNDSFTPPGILKPCQTGAQNSSPAQNERAVMDGEEKVLRFDLPHGTTLEDSCLVDDAEPSREMTYLATSTATTPVIRRDLDLSGISNDDFYSPEATMEPSSLQQVLAASISVPAGRPSIHRSRSGTPSASTDAASNNIAIIIEDHLEDDCFSNKADEPQQQQQQQYEEMEVDAEKNGSSKEHVFVIDDSDAEQVNANEDKAQEAETHDRDEIVIVDEESSHLIELETGSKNEVMDTYACEDEFDQEAIASETYQANQAHAFLEQEDVAEELDSVDEHGQEEEVDEEESDPDEDVEDDDVIEDTLVYDEYSGNDEDIDEDEDEYEEEDDEENNDVNNGGDDDSILEIIDLSDDDERERADIAHSNEGSSSESSSPSNASSSSSSSDGDDDDPEQAAATVSPDAPEQQDGLWHYEESVSNDEQQQQRQEHQGAADDMMDYIQVPTTSSSTHRTERKATKTASDPQDEAESSEVEDLSVPQQETRDLTVAADGEQWPDSVASSSSSHAVIAAGAAPAATAGAGAASSTAAATSPRDSQSQATPPQEKLFGQPKNAHELEVPAMNLSVKPDEAHGSSRKNSKGEENGLNAEDARALNLSAGQQDAAGGVDDGNDVSSNQEEVVEQQENDKEEVTDAGDTEETVQNVQEAQSSDGAKAEEELEESEDMEVDLRISDDDVVQDEKPAEDDSKPEEEPVEEDKQEEASKQQAAKKYQKLQQLQDEEEASTSSTPRTNVKTRLMAAMEKTGPSSVTSEQQISTPTRRRSVRASSVAPETTNTPISPMLSRSRRYTSMDNLMGTPEPTLPLTPRRSTRASSLAKELFTGSSSTPVKRPRRTSQASNDTNRPDSAANSPTDSAMEPPEPSERSFASSTASSTRRSMRARKTTTTGAAANQSPESNAPLLADYSSNRRLTRHQLAVMEKSMETIASSSQQARRRVSVGRGSKAGSKADTAHEEGTEAGDSESESVVSNVSNQSSLRSTRSRTNRASTTRSKRGSVKGTDAAEAHDSDSDQSLVYAGSQRSTIALEPIAEEGESSTPKARKLRGRPPKSGK